MNGLAHVLGLDDPSSGPYLFWSGFGAVLLSNLSILGVGLGWAVKHNCHEPRCHRLARIQVPDSTYYVCHRHHLDSAIIRSRR